MEKTDLFGSNRSKGGATKCDLTSARHQNSSWGHQRGGDGSLSPPRGERGDVPVTQKATGEAGADVQQKLQCAPEEMTRRTLHRHPNFLTSDGDSLIRMSCPGVVTAKNTRREKNWLLSLQKKSYNINIRLFLVLFSYFF